MDDARAGALVTIDRVHAARDLAADTGVDLLVLTPGSDLRYLSGYNAHAAVVVHELEEVAVAGDDVDRPAGAGGQRADDVVRLVAGGADP